MKKIFVFLLTGVCLVSAAFSQEYDIRKLKWGMSYDEVQQAEQLDTNFYKSEDLLGMKVEVLFGCGNKGLYSVTYSTQEKIFAAEALKVMKKKYGEPKSDLDYYYLLQIKNVLKIYPDAVILALEKEDFSGLAENRASSASGEKKLIKNALTKRYMWEFGNTTALLLDSIEGGALSYWSKTHFNESKQKFIAYIEELKKLAQKPAEKSKKDEGEKF